MLTKEDETGITSEEQGVLNYIVAELHMMYCNFRNLCEQKSQLTWLSEGDSNTHFFHHTVVVWRAKNIISRFKIRTWICVQTKNEIANEFLSILFHDGLVMSNLWSQVFSLGHYFSSHF